MRYWTHFWRFFIASDLMKSHRTLFSINSWTDCIKSFNKLSQVGQTAAEFWMGTLDACGSFPTNLDNMSSLYNSTLGTVGLDGFIRGAGGNFLRLSGFAAWQWRGSWEWVHESEFNLNNNTIGLIHCHHQSF